MFRRRTAPGTGGGFPGFGGGGGGGGGASLPTTSASAPSAFHFSSGSRDADGSGKAIRMEAPLARDWKRQSGYTKGTYYSLFISLCLLYFGYRYLRYEHSSIWLTCHVQDCTLDITPRGFQKTKTIQFPRRQLIKAEALKTDKQGNLVAVSPRLDDFNDIPAKSKVNPNSKYKKNRSGRSSSYKGPDLDGHYPSYRLVLRQAEEEKEENKDNKDDNTNTNPNTNTNTNTNNEEEWKEMDMNPIQEYTDVVNNDNDPTEFHLIMRKFKIHHSRRRVTSSVRKIDSYIKNRRQKLTVKENSAPCWQGIVIIVIGLFAFLISLLLGQFWDPIPKKHSGPGIRRQQQQQQRQQQQHQRSSIRKR